MDMIEKIRILMVLTNTGRGGSQAYVMNILREIDMKRFDVDVVTSVNPFSGYGQEIQSLGCNLYILPQFKVWNYLSYERAWKNFFSKHSYDIVHAHATSSASLFFKIAKERGCVTIAHSHNSLYRGNWIEKKMKRIFVRGLKDQSDYWFSCSEKASPRLFGEKYADNPHYYELPNAIDVIQYRYDDEKRTKIRNKYGLDNDDLLFGHVGTFSEPKNHIFLIEIFKEIYKRNQKSKLMLVGDGPLRNKVKMYVEKAGLSNKVIMTGNVSNVNEYMCGMDTMIFPSLFEGFPVTLVEAQAAGLYTVMSDEVTKSVMLTDCICHLSLSNTASEWADVAIHNPVTDRKKYNDELSQTKYDIHRSIQQLVSLYEEMKMIHEAKDARHEI